MSGIYYFFWGGGTPRSICSPHRLTPHPATLLFTCVIFSVFIIFLTFLWNVCIKRRRLILMSLTEGLGP